MPNMLAIFRLGGGEGGGATAPSSAKLFLAKLFSVRGVWGGGTFLTEKIRKVVFEGITDISENSLFQP